MKTGKIIQQEDIQDILELTKISNIFEAPTTSSNSNKWRNSLKYQVNYQLFPELCKTIEDFENKISEYVGSKYAVAVSSATHGQDLVLKAVSYTHLRAHET